MKKQTWEEPQILVQKFMPNEYIAACGDSGITYNFECNAGEAGHQYAIWDGTYKQHRYGNTPNYSTINGHKFDGNWYFTPCKKTHEADSDSGFLTGYYLDDTSTRTVEKIPVVIWTDNHTDVHCTTNLDMNSWTTAKS